MLQLEMELVRLHSGLEMLRMVQLAMCEVDEGQNEYAQAIYGIFDYLKDVEGKLNKAIGDEDFDTIG